MTAPTVFSGTQAGTVPGGAYSLAPDVAVIWMEDGSARLLDMADRFYAVPPVGARLLRHTLEHGPAAAAERVAAEYGVDLPRVRDDLSRFLAPLERQGVLRRGPGRARRPGPAAFLAAVLLRVILSLLPSRRARAAALLTAARLSLLVFGWARTVAAWRQQFPLHRESLAPARAEAAARAIDEAVCDAAARHPLGVACKERALCCWALARAAGLPAALVIGIESYPLAGHCWCEAGPWVLSDHADNCARYTPVLRYQ